MDNNASFQTTSFLLSKNISSQPAKITTVLFSSVIATGFPGNLLIVMAILKRQQLRTSCYTLILSISIADLGTALIAAPQRIIDNYIGCLSFSLHSSVSFFPVFLPRQPAVCTHEVRPKSTCTTFTSNLRYSVSRRNLRKYSNFFILKLQHFLPEKSSIVL